MEMEEDLEVPWPVVVELDDGEIDRENSSGSGGLGGGVSSSSGEMVATDTASPASFTALTAYCPQSSS